MANRPNALQSLRRSQCSSASVRTTCQCLTSIRVSASRHSYGKTAATVRTMCDPVRTMFSIRQDVHTKFNRPNNSLHGPDDQASYMEIACTNSTIRMPAIRVRMLQSLIMVITCNRPDARATSSGRGLVMEAFSAILERWLQLTVQTLGQAVRTPSGILIITFYSNIELGRNWRSWKANKKLYKLTIQKANKSIRTAPIQMETSGVRTALQKFQNYFSDKEKVARPDGQGSCPDSCATDSVFYSI
jgi:hypothetical protein